MVAGLVVNHWVLDVLTHRPDMPASLSDTTHIGAGLWNHPVLAVSLELLLFAFCVWLYARKSKPLDRQGSIGFWALTIFLLVIYASNLLGPPPPSVTAVAWSVQGVWLLVAWGFRVDRHRVRRDGR